MTCGAFKLMNVSSLIKYHMSRKEKDRGRFTILPFIGNSFKGRVFCDLKASINLKPSTIFEKLGVESCKPTPMVLKLTDLSFTHVKGIFEDVIVKVNKFMFMVDL